MWRCSNDFDWDQKTGSPDLLFIPHPEFHTHGTQERLRPAPNPHPHDAQAGLYWEKVGLEPVRSHEDMNRHMNDTTTMHS